MSVSFPHRMHINKKPALEIEPGINPRYSWQVGITSSIPTLVPNTTSYGCFKMLLSLVCVTTFEWGFPEKCLSKVTKLYSFYLLKILLLDVRKYYVFLLVNINVFENRVMYKCNYFTSFSLLILLIPLRVSILLLPY